MPEIVSVFEAIYLPETMRSTGFSERGPSDSQSGVRIFAQDRRC